MKTPVPTDKPPPTAPLADMAPLFVTAPPARNASPVLPEMEPVLDTTPLLTSDMPKPEADETGPALEMVQVVRAGPSMPSAPEPVAFTFPVLVMVSGLLAVPSTTGPATLPLIVLPCRAAAARCGVVAACCESVVVTKDFGLSSSGGVIPDALTVDSDVILLGPLL